MPSSSQTLKLGETSIKHVQFSKSKKDSRLRQNSRFLAVAERPPVPKPVPKPAITQAQIYSIQHQPAALQTSPDDMSSIAEYHSFASGEAQPMDQNDVFEGAPEPRIDHNIGERNNTSRKRTETPKSNPLENWLPHRKSYLDELLILEGCGPIGDSTRCSACRKLHTTTDIYRCLECRGVKTQCKGCILASHSRLHFHRTQKWTGSFWKTKSLYDLGLIYQLGHPHDERCPSPGLMQDVSILHVNGFHKIAVIFCKCAMETRLTTPYVQFLIDRLYPASPKSPATAFTFELLDFYVEASSNGKISLQHFYHTMSRLTDNTDLNLPIKKHYDEFGHVVRCYRHLLLMKRGGSAHQGADLTITKHGSLAVECPACPQPGRNLLPGWEQQAAVQRHRYGLYLGLDANFKLKRWLRGNGRDKELGPGWAYFADHEALQQELSRVKAVPPPVEPVFCESQHAAIENANSTTNAKCDCTGVAGVVCTRHGLIRPQALTDLQVGERQINMDFVFLSAIINTALIYIFLSYDIACQWSVHLLRRGTLFPSLLSRILETIIIVFGIPKFHLPAHGSKCRSKFSLNFCDGWARVDGEAMERVWSFLNGFAPASREMATGARHDFLDYQVGSMNFRKVVELGNNLLERLEDAEEGIEVHSKAFEELQKACEASEPGITDRWDKLISSWQENHDLKPDPYQDDDTLGKSNLNLVKTALLEEELSDLRSISITGTGRTETTESTFIAEGLELEEAQLAVHATARRNQETLSKTELLRFKKNQVTLLRRIMKWMAKQDRFMPGTMLHRLEKTTRLASQPTNSAQALDEDDLSDDDDERNVFLMENLEEEDDEDFTPNSLGLSTKPEDIDLLLPSSLPSQLRTRCSASLCEKEHKLRLAIMEGELYQLRRLLQIKSAVFFNKKANIAGQRDSTRSNQTIKSFTKRIRLHAQYYRASWKAAEILAPGGPWHTRYLDLADGDIRAYNQDEADDLYLSDSGSDPDVDSDNENLLPRHSVKTRKRRKKRQKVANAQAQQVINALGEGHRVVSWIWRMGSGEPGQSEHRESREVLQTEYAKSKARLGRWVEEKDLVIEEMRHVPRFMEHKASWWEGLIGEELRQPPELHLGLKAYAAKQANTHRALTNKFLELWSPVLQKLQISLDVSQAQT